MFTPVDSSETSLPGKDDLVFPLSFAQRRLWFLHQLEPNSAFYNLPLSVPFKVAVNAAVLERAINAIIERHETLRTVFASVNAEPMQIVRSRMAVSLTVIDLRQQPKEEKEAETSRLIAAMAQKQFDLAYGPLLRVALLSRGPQDNVFVLVMHHIISDGWSLGIFWNELVTLYNATYGGYQPSLLELPIQYADFAVWQREQLQGNALADQLAYWRKQLANVPTLQLPTDHLRPPVLSYRGASTEIIVPRLLTKTLKALSQREGVTLFMTLFAAFAVLLQRYCGQDDIVVGLPSAGRERKELEGLIGFFVNSLVLRVDLSGDPSFRELLARVRETALEAYAYQELPFEKLVEEIKPTRDLSRNPLFQVSFQLFSPAEKRARVAPTDAAPKTVVTRGSAIFDLAVNLWEATDEIGGHIEYSTDLFEAPTVERYAKHYRTVLKSISTNPNAKLSELRLLGEAEQRQLLLEWNDTRAPVPPYCIHELFEQQAEHQPDALAVSARDGRLTYRELNRRANQLAHRLRGNGVGRDTPVCLCVERGLTMVVGFLAILKAGGAYVPVDPGYPSDRLALMLDDSAAKVVLTERAMAGLLPAHDAALVLLDDDQDDADDVNADYGVKPADLCYVIYTSGSTGRPKGVAVPHRGLMNLVAWHRKAFAISPSDRAGQVASLGFDACGWEVWPYLATGASVHIIDDDLRLSPRALVKALNERQITICFLPTPLAQMIFGEPAYVELKLRYLLTGGDRLTRGPPRDAKFITVNNYGPTEYSVVATSCTLDAGRHSSPPIGRPIANTQIYVLDSYLNPVPIGVTGELYIGGQGLARGYHNCPDLTAERFVHNTLSETVCARLYKTGDRVRYRPDGMLEYLGRTDNQIKIRGFRIEPGEIEAVITAHKDISDAVVSAISRDGKPGQLVAYVVPHQYDSYAGNGTGNSARQYLIEALQGRLRTQLPDYMMPARFVVLPELPQTPNGKVDHNALPAPDSALDNSKTYAAPRGALEGVLADMWAEILNLERVGIADNFFEIGGHSLLAARLISRVRDRLRVEVPLQALFRSPTPAQFAAGLLASAEDPIALQRTAELVASVASLSDADVKRMLAQSATIPEGKI
jgi:amino acid adenylation domain-containing protein